MMILMKPITRAVRLSLLAALPGTVIAQQTDDMVYLPALDVRSLVPTSVEGMPGAASLLTREQIDIYKPYTLHDALDFVPGVKTIDDDALGRRSGIGVRGAPSRRSRKVLLLEDGTPINNSAYLDSGAHYTPPLERIERAEVYKGAGQIVHGPLNNHGIINFQNLQPTLVPETVIEVGAGSQDTIQQHIHHRRTEGDVGMVFSYTGKQADGTFDVEEHQYDDFYTGLEWQVNERNQLAASVTYLRERSDGYDENNLSLQEYREAPRNKSRFNEGREDNNISVNYLKYDLTHNLQVTDDVSVSSKVFFTDLDRPRFQTRGTAPADGGVMEGRDRRYENLGVESRLEWANIEALGLDHRIQTGVRYENHNFEDRRPVGLPGEKLDEGSRGRLFAVSGEDGYTRDGRLIEYDAEAISGYVQNSMSWGDWTVTPGLRYENFNQYKDTVFRPGSSDEGVREKDSNSLFLPGVSLLYSGLANSEVYAGIHRGYAPASARSDDFPLTPETGVNSQLGLRTTAIKGVSLDAAVFHNRIKDTLIRDDVDAFGDALFVNSADSEVTGVDVGARIDSSAFYVADYNLFAEAALNYTDSRFTTGPLDGNRVPEVPTRAGSFTIGADHLSGWHLSATVSHFGSFYSDIENTRELTADGEAGKVPSRTLFSARGSYKLPINTDATLWVQGRNLSDKLYISDVQDGIRPGAERTVVAGATVKF